MSHVQVHERGYAPFTRFVRFSDICERVRDLRAVTRREHERPVQAVVHPVEEHDGDAELARQCDCPVLGRIVRDANGDEPGVWRDCPEEPEDGDDRGRAPPDEAVHFARIHARSPIRRAGKLPIGRGEAVWSRFSGRGHDAPSEKQGPRGSSREKPRGTWGREGLGLGLGLRNLVWGLVWGWGLVGTPCLLCAFALRSFWLLLVLLSSQVSVLLKVITTSARPFAKTARARHRTPRDRRNSPNSTAAPHRGGPRRRIPPDPP